MVIKIFFSWQADSPNKTNRNFIEDAIRKALAQITDDAQLDLSDRKIEFDKDTLGEPGQPEIVNTIFRKIDEAGVYIADMTFTSQRSEGTYSPNPNVLIEYGRAIKALGVERTLCVMNTHFGKPSEKSLPFNLRHLRWPHQYEYSGADDTAAKSKQELVTYFKMALAAIISRLTIPKPDRPLFAALPKAQSRFRQNYQEPLGITADMFAGGKPIMLAAGAVTWLRLTPKYATEVPFLETQLKDAIFKGGTKFIRDFRPSTLRASDGFGLFAKVNNSDDSTPVCFFAFKTGEVWSCDATVVDEQRHHNGCIPPLEQHWISCLTKMHDFICALHLPGPFQWVAGIEGIQGLRLRDVRGHLAGFRGLESPSVTDVVVASGDYDEGGGAASSLEPFFIALWDACGSKRQLSG